MIGDIPWRKTVPDDTTQELTAYFAASGSEMHVAASANTTENRKTRRERLERRKMCVEMVGSDGRLKQQNLDNGAEMRNKWACLAEDVHRAGNLELGSDNVGPPVE